MRIDNGHRTKLVIPGVFSGACGLSRGVVSFAPARGLKLAPVYAAQLDGSPVVLRDVAPSDDGVNYSAKVLG